MKRIASALCALSMLAAISCNDTATDTSAKGDSTANKTDTTAKIETPAPAPDSAAMMKAWMEYMTPGEMHKVLALQNGAWTGDITLWMAPDAPAQTSKGTSVNKMIFGGRYQESRYSGNFMGQPMEGLGITAYDNAKKKFVSNWLDNMGTGIMSLEGTYDPATKTINLSGKMVDPTTGKECDIRETLTFVDDKHHTMEMFVTQGSAKEYKSMEIKFTKK